MRNVLRDLNVRSVRACVVEGDPIGALFNRRFMWNYEAARLLQEHARIFQIVDRTPFTMLLKAATTALRQLEKEDKRPAKLK